MPTFTTAQSGYRLQAMVQVIGLDLLIAVTGGSNPHIGAVTTLTATTSPKTVRFPSHDGRQHKDHVISESLAKQLQPVLTGSCTITAGVHVNQITKAQIAAAGPMTQVLGTQILQWLHEQPIQAPQPQYYQSGETPQ